MQSQIPEIKKWTNLLSPPLRTNVQILIPPPDSISSKVEVILAPFIQDMRLNNTTYLIIVRGTIVIWISFCYTEAGFFKGINKGSVIFLHLLKALKEIYQVVRPVAFYHRNTSEPRKKEILQDLKLPLNSPLKKLTCVVSTVSLGKLVRL